jgi:hypothetical protein
VSTEHHITKRAADGILTIAELRQFLDEFDKLAAPAIPLPPAQPSAMDAFKPKARVSFGGGLKSISVTIPGEGQQ